MFFHLEKLFFHLEKLLIHLEKLLFHLEKLIFHFEKLLLHAGDYYRCWEAVICSWWHARPKPRNRSARLSLRASRSSSATCLTVSATFITAPTIVTIHYCV